MKKTPIDYESWQLQRGQRDNETYICPTEGLCLSTDGKAGQPFPGWEDGKNRWLVFDLECLEKHSAAFDLCLWEQGNEGEFDMRIMFGILPGVRTTIALPLELLNSQKLFPERNPGCLKLGVFGKPVERGLVYKVALTTTSMHEEQRIKIYGAYLCGEKPEITLLPQPLMDELGQWAKWDWPGKTQNRAQCNICLRMDAESPAKTFTDPELDQWGGWKEKPLTKTGYFHAEKADGRWWLADPEGNAFLSTGVDCVNPGVDTRVDVMREFIPDPPPRTEEFAPIWSQKGPFEFANFGIANLIHAFGVNWWEDWAKISKNYLLEQGFNTIGNWSQPEFIRWANMPYVLPMAGFPGTKDMIFRDFPDVFDPEFAHNSQIFAQQLTPLAGDRNLIGYFLRNEPEWAFVYDLCIAEELLAHPKPLVSKYALLDWLRKKYETPENWSAAWGKKFAEFKDVLTPIHRASKLSVQAAADLKEFSEEMIRRYVTLPSQECRKNAPNHMNLGMRYAYITDKSLLAGYENFDVFSINSYQISPFEQVEQVGRLLDKPVMIGEFHHGALDRGLSATGIRGVASQEERAVAYQYYMEQGAASRYFVGAHYFQFNDQSALGRFDGENYQIGLVDVCMRKYPEIARCIRECHSRIYMVANGQLPSYNKRPEEIPALHY